MRNKITTILRLFFLVSILAVLSGNVFCTDVTISAGTLSQLPFNPTGIGSDRSITVSVTSGSPTVTSSGAFPSQIVGIKGFQVTITGNQYTVASVASTSTLILTTNYTGSNGTQTMTLYKYALLRVYNTSSLSFRPLGTTDIVMPGAPPSGFFYRQVAVSFVTNGVDQIGYLPQFTVPATTDALISNQATLSFVFCRPDGSILAYYSCGAKNKFQIPTTSPTTLPDICVFNSPGGIVPPANVAYTKAEIDARFPSCTTGQMIYYAATGNTQSCLTVGSGLAIAGGTITTTGGAGSMNPTDTVIPYRLNSSAFADSSWSVGTNLAATSTITARTSGAPTHFFRLITPADTGLTASQESVGAQIGGNTSAATVTRQWATGAISTQRENLFIRPTYAFVGASTISDAATVAITGAPVAGTNATINFPYALWVQAGNSKFEGNVQTQNITAGGFVSIGPATPLSIKNTTLRVDSPSFTGLTGGSDTINDILLEAAGVINFAGGGAAFTSQRNIVAVPGSYTANAAQTITTAATLAIEGASTAGSNITITNNYALWVQAGKTQFDGVVGQASHADWTRIAAPANPASGFLRLFANNSTGKLACLDSAGADCIPAWGSGTLNPTDTVIPYRSNATTLADSQLIRISSSVTDLRNSSTSQVFNIYNTSDAGAASPTNFERLGLKFSAGPVILFASEAGGTGVTPLTFHFSGANVGVGTNSPGAQFGVISSATNKIAGIIRSAASPSVDIFRVNRDTSSPFRIDSFGAIISATDVRTSGSDRFVLIVTPPDTGLAADTESIGIQLGGNASAAAVTRQFTAGAGTFIQQREIVAVRPRYDFTSADTIDTAATFSITGPPIAGTNATITNSYALWVDAGSTFLGGNLLSQAIPRTGSPLPYVRVITPADTTLTASTESIGIQLGGNSSVATVTRQFATGAITTQRENVFVHPTYGFVGASTITTAATVAISAAPVAGTNATITAPFALLIQSGSIGVPQGSASLPSIRDASDTGSSTGFYFRQSGVNASIDAVTGGTVQFALNQNGFQIRSAAGYGISSGDPALAAPDVGWARDAAGVFRITNGSTGAGQLLVAPDTDTAGAQADIRSQSTSRIGLRVDSLANSTVDLAVLNLNADDTSTVANLATFAANSNGTPANGFGQSTSYTLETTTTNDQLAARVDVLWSNATHASRTSDIVFTTVNSATTQESFRITGNALPVWPATNTAGGTTGNQTINKPSGTVNFAATATTLTVTNSLVTTSSIVFAVVRTNDTTAAIKNVVPASGSFVITLTAAATAETSVGFFVMNK